MQTRAQQLEGARLRSRRYREKHRDKVNHNARHAASLRRYGITPDEKWALLDTQGGRCAICRTSEPGRRGWQVDHDHKSGKVRGILCARCNLALGNAHDDVVTLQMMIDYLNSHRGAAR